MEKIELIKDAKYIIIKSGEIYVASEDIKEFYNTDVTHKKKKADLERTIMESLRNAGIPASLRGYRYLMTAIKEVMDDETMLDGITKILYPQIAKQHRTTPQRVEKGIRHAIECGWKRDVSNVIRNEFRQTLKEGQIRPTNSEFIAVMAQHVSMYTP